MLSVRMALNGLRAARALAARSGCDVERCTMVLRVAQVTVHRCVMVVLLQVGCVKYVACSMLCCTVLLFVYVCVSHVMLFVVAVVFVL